jgi:hypothetical protein
VTCHGEVNGRVLSARALEAQCNQCHGPGEAAPRANRAADARAMYERLSVIREQFKLAASLVRRAEGARRDELQQVYQQAEVPLIRAVNAGHQFVYDDMQSYLEVAQARVEDLLRALANQPR